MTVARAAEERSAEEGTAERLLDLARQKDLRWIWTREEGLGPADLVEGEEEQEQGPEGSEVSPDGSEARSSWYTLEVKVDMLLLVLPKVAERLAEVGEALRSRDVPPDLRMAILDTHRIIKRLE